MIGSVFSLKKDTPLPQDELELAIVHLDSARNAKSPETTLMYCNKADAVLSGIKRLKKKDLIASSAAEDRVLCYGIAATYFALGELLSRSGYREMAHASDKKAEKWG